MNKQRRKELGALYDRIVIEQNRYIELQQNCEAIKDELTAVQEAEQGAFDAMPEGLQQGERGQDAENGLQEIGNAIDGMQEVFDADFSFDDWLSSIDNARGQES